jgi:hypothetical protein
MNFCKECDNYLSLKMEEMNSSIQDKLIYTCRNCGFEEEYNEFHKNNTDNINCIYKDYCDENKILESNENITNYLDKDPTLPRVSNITCPNETCLTNDSLSVKELIEKDKNEEMELKIDSDGTLKNEVIYTIINKSDMVFKYICCHCKTIWTNA